MLSISETADIYIKCHAKYHQRAQKSLWIFPQALSYLLCIGLTHALFSVKPDARPKVDIVKKLERELERLNYQFRKDRITIEEYDRDYEDLVKRINEARACQAAIENPVQKDFSALRKRLETDIDSLYKTFTR